MVQKTYKKEAVNYEFQCIVEVLLCVSTKQLPQNYIFTYINCKPCKLELLNKIGKKYDRLTMHRKKNSIKIDYFIHILQ